MLLKVVLLLVVIVLILYFVLPAKRADQLAATVGRRGNRVMMVLLTLGAIVMFLISALCALIWLGSIAGGVTGGGEVLQSDTLLRLAGLFLVLSLVCAALVVYGRGKG